MYSKLSCDILSILYDQLWNMLTLNRCLLFFRSTCYSIIAICSVSRCSQPCCHRISDLSLSRKGFSPELIGCITRCLFE